MKTIKIYGLILFGLFLNACGNNEGFAPSVDLGGALTISPSAVTLAINNQVAFTASGGSGSYSYSIFSGSGSILSTTGAYTAPSSSGTAVVRVVDGKGRYADAIVTINGALQISPTTQSLGLNATQAFTVTGGVPPISFSRVSGGGSIDGTGLYTAPSSPGTAKVRATDSLGNTSDANISIYGALGISPLLQTLAVNNNISFSAGGGIPPYAYSIVSGGGSINASTGYFMAPSSSGSVTVRVTDSIGSTSNAIVTVNAALQISPTSQLMLVGNTVTFSAIGGVSPLSFSIASGSGSMNSSTGDYTAPISIGSAVVRVTDSYGNTSDANVTITQTLSISPSAKTLAVNNQFTFSGSGGTPPLSYSMVSGGGSIDSVSGVYTAPASSGSAVVRVSDSLGATADANVTVNAALAISPSSQTLAINGTLSFSSSGGVIPYTYSVVSGSGSINASTGAYTASASTGTDVVRVTDSLGNTTDATITINNALGINPAAVTLAVNNTKTFSGLAGAPPYTFSIVSGGGSITSPGGVFTAPATSGTAIVQVKDSLNNTAQATVTVNPALAISPSSKTIAVNNVFTFSATGGVSPYTYSIVSGGGSINSSTGAYTAPASSGSATVRVTDGYGNTSNATVTINNALAISPTTAIITVVDTKTFTTSGGVSPYAYSIVSGTGSINASGGLYTPSGAGTITIRSTDAIGNTSDATLIVNTALAITPASAYVDTDSDFTFDFTGGVPPVSYSVIAGGGSFADSSVGIYTAPSTTGSATVRVTDALGHTSNASVTIYNSLTLSPTTWTMGINSTKTFTATGGVGTLTFAMVSGNGSINSSSGLYTSPAGASTETIQVSDTIGNVATAEITVVSTLTISPQTLKLPVFSTATFSAVLGTSPYTYSVVSGGGSINVAVYTAPATIGSGVVRVTDNTASTSDANITHIKPIEMVSGANHTCVRYDEGSVKCWGDAAFGQLGNGSTSDWGDNANEGGGFLPFVNLGTGRTAKQIVAGFNHNCALLDNNSVKCWGSGSSGQLGQGSTSNIGGGVNQMGDNLPTVNLGTGRTATKLYAFGNISCATLDNGQTKCWGYNRYGSLGLGDTNSRGDAANEMGDSLPAINFGTGRTAVKMTGGLDFMCALLDNATVKCWGYNKYGQTGYGIISTSTYIGDTSATTGDNLNPVNFGAGRTVVELSSGYNHTCAILDDSNLKCWGRSKYGELGQGNATTLSDPSTVTAISLGTGFTPAKVWGGRYSTCALSTGGVLKCWGYNFYGQTLIGTASGNSSSIGDQSGEMGTSLVAANLGTGFTISNISMGYYFNCALLSNDRIKCWGYALNGALLNASTNVNLGDAPGELGNSLPYVNH